MITVNSILAFLTAQATLLATPQGQVMLANDIAAFTKLHTIMADLLGKLAPAAQVAQPAAVNPTPAPKPTA
jgi:hypothetical protein